jgi:hypothetical protein
MQIRRLVAAFSTALAVCVGGATLTGCAAGGQSSDTGTPQQTDPQRVSRLHDNLPNLSDPVTGNPRNRNGAQDEGGG